ncbi:Dihydroorotate dehydrogenase [Nesidiocoris tenuis]|uniref:Dihydroorotate dehydrogenase (quinone), mitochondrial n=1 Tax=Nesidiocoris tenuis TaxID=355587 RepID=A0ABN7ALQ7_9HEMI|nr:Dihydroorotate dehydrogenase [Nesidiocoris tenuis]
MCELNKLIPPSRLKSLALICTSATGLFAGYCLMNEDEQFYEKALIPLTHCFNPETAHNMAVMANKYRLIPKSPYKDPPSLKSKAWNLNFTNPIGMAAGFDKHGEAVENLHDIGFGFVEIGSVTPLPQPGNEKPRVFRLAENEAVINRYGFNSEGHQAVFERIKRLKDRNFQGVVGVNLGKNKTSADPIQDYVSGIQLFGPVADYLVINISSPNTPGLRDWQNKDQLEKLLTTLVQVRNELPGRKPPLLLKLAPDLTESQRKDIGKLVLQKKCRIDGLVISNTSIERGPELIGEHVNEAGGLSGRPISDLSTKMIQEMRNITKGEIPIIGVGGLSTGQDAFDKIKAGASLVQLYTAYVYHGPPRVTRIKKELDEALRKNGYNCVTEAIGSSQSKAQAKS